MVNHRLPDAFVVSQTCFALAAQSFLHGFCALTSVANDPGGRSISPGSPAEARIDGGFQ
jgi:hypothetical protein